jgi:hypothetical protein
MKFSIKTLRKLIVSANEPPSECYAGNVWSGAGGINENTKKDTHYNIIL